MRAREEGNFEVIRCARLPDRPLVLSALVDEAAGHGGAPDDAPVLST